LLYLLHVPVVVRNGKMPLTVVIMPLQVAKLRNGRSLLYILTSLYDNQPGSTVIRRILLVERMRLGCLASVA